MIDVENESKEFWDTLKDLYCHEHGTTKEFEAEERQLRAAIGHIRSETEFATVYEMEKPIGVGGAGIVIKLKDKRLGLYRALKCGRLKKMDTND